MIPYQGLLLALWGAENPGAAGIADALVKPADDRRRVDPNTQFNGTLLANWFDANTNVRAYAKAPMWLRDDGRRPDPNAQTNLYSLLFGTDQFFGGAGQGPNYDWPLPRVPFQFVRTHLQQSLLEEAPPTLSAQTDWPLPRAAYYPPDLRTWLQGRPTSVEFNPVVETDWPTPRSLYYPPDLRSWFQSRPTSEEFSPAIQTDWPNPVLVPRFDRGWFQTTTGLIVPVVITVPPIQQDDWPLPRRQFYPIDASIAGFRIPAPIPSNFAPLLHKAQARARIRSVRRHFIHEAPTRQRLVTFVPGRQMKDAPELRPPIIVGAQETVGWDFGPALATGVSIIGVPQFTILVSPRSLSIDPTPQARILSAAPVFVPSTQTGAPNAEVHILFGGNGLIADCEYIGVCQVSTSDGQAPIDFWRLWCRNPG